MAGQSGDDDATSQGPEATGGWSDGEGPFESGVLAETVPDAVVVIDVGDDRVVYANEAAVDLFERSRDSIVGGPFQGLRPTMEADRYEELLDRIVRTGEVTAARFENEGGLHVLTGDGNRVPVEISARRIEHGGDTLVLGVFRDVTERKERDRTLERLHEATREMMRTDDPVRIAEIAGKTAEEILDLPLNGIFLYDEEENVLVPARSSPAVRDLVGDVPQFGPGDSLAWQVFESGEAQVHSDVTSSDDVHNPDTPIRSEFVIPMDGHGVFLASSTEIDDFDAQDVSLAKVLATNTETAIDRAERERRLQERTRQLKTVLDNAPVVLFALDADGEFVLSEGSRLSELGLEPGELVGEHVTDVYDGEVVEGVLRALEGERVRMDVAIDGRVFDIWYRPVHEDGAVDGVIGVAVDVTERERRTGVIEVLDRLLRHNLRNSLNVVRGYAATIEHEAEGDLADAARQIDEQSSEIVGMSEKARELRVALEDDEGAGSVDLRRVLVAVNNELRDACDEADPRFDVPDATLPVDERAQIPLREVCENAVEHGGGSPTVTVEKEGDRVRIDVVDDGVGIPAEERAIVESGEETPLEHGSGLGIPVAYWTVRYLGGDISVSDHDQRGSVVSVELPLDSKNGNGH